MIAIDLTKQQGIDTDPNTIQQIDFTVNPAWDPIANTTMFSIIGEAKEIILDFSQGAVKVLIFRFVLT